MTIEDTILGLPQEGVIAASLFISIIALLVALRGSFGRAGSDGLPQPNYAAIVSAGIAVLIIAVTAAVYVTGLENRVTELEREVGNLRPTHRALAEG